MRHERQAGAESSRRQARCDRHLLSVDPDEADTIYVDVDDDVTYSTNKYVGRHIKISDEAYLTVSSQLFCCNGVSITIEEGSRLIVRGGEINNVILKPQKGEQHCNRGRWSHQT